MRFFSAPQALNEWALFGLLLALIPFGMGLGWLFGFAFYRGWDKNVERQVRRIEAKAAERRRDLDAIRRATSRRT